MKIELSSFSLTAEDGATVRGDVRFPEGSTPDSAVVVVHGFKGFKDWGFFPWVCQELAGEGHAVVSFNLSHNGIGDDPLHFTELERFARNTLSRELDEVGRVLSALRAGALPAFDGSGRVGLLGHSRGGGQAVLAAAENGVDALVTWAAVADFDRWSDDVKEEWRSAGRIHVANARTGQQMPLDVGLLEDFEENRERLDVLAAAGRIQAPWLVVHGADDETVTPHDGRRLAQASRGRLVLVEGAGHTFEARHPFEGAPPELSQAFAATREHFGRHLAG